MCIFLEPCTQETRVGGLDLVFVLDSSGSITDVNYERMKNSLVDLVEELTISPNDTRVAVIIFGTNVTLLFNLNTYTEKQPLIDAIIDIPYYASLTNTSAALGLLRTSAVQEILGIRQGRGHVHIAIVITDGQSNDKPETKIQAELLHNNTDFHVFAIGVGNNVDQDELSSIASNNNSVINIDSFGSEQLQELEQEIIVEICRGKYKTTVHSSYAVDLLMH